MSQVQVLAYLKAAVIYAEDKDFIQVLAKIEAVGGKKEDLLRLMADLVPVSRTDEGCLQYDLVQRMGNPDVITVVELWQSHELWQAHLAQPHFHTFAAKLEGISASIEIGAYVPIDFKPTA
eukprot:Colp12_sorted_trinity150504_noHs@6106